MLRKVELFWKRKIRMQKTCRLFKINLSKRILSVRMENAVTARNLEQSINMLYSEITELDRENATAKKAFSELLAEATVARFCQIFRYFFGSPAPWRQAQNLLQFLNRIIFPTRIFLEIICSNKSPKYGIF